MTLSTKVLIGLGLGIGAGIFFGETAAFLKVFGDVFILLLQMTVLPYVMVSLIAGLGGLSFHEAASLGRKCGLLLLVLWAMGLLMVLVIPFAFPAWESASFFSTSLIEPRRPFSFFGDPTVAIPFLLDLLRIPSDTYRFFLVVDNLVGSRFGTLLAAMYTLVLAVLGACAVGGLAKIRWRRLLRYGAMSVVLTVCTIGATRFLFEHVMPHQYRESQVFVQMDLSREQTPATIHKSTLPPPPSHDAQRSRLPEIRERGYLRIGYFEDALPFAFENQAGKLVGFDVEMAYRLAQDMKVALDLVLIDRAQAAAMLNGGYVDMIMSGVAVTVERAQEMTLSAPYTNETLASSPKTIAAKTSAAGRT